MEKLDKLVADHIEHRLLLPSRLEKILSSVLDRREERSERQATHIAGSRKRATEADAKLKRLYDAIENGVTDLSDLMLKDRITELKAIRDQARADTERAEGAIERLGPTSPPNPSRSLPGRPASEREPRAGVIAATIFACSPSASKSTPKNFASWRRKANCCARSSPLQAQKRRVLACPVLYRSGALGEIRTPDPRIRSPMLYPAELRARFRMLRISELFGQFYGGANGNIQGTFPEGRLLLPVSRRRTGIFGANRDA
jgi:hypothetical protein